MGDSRQATETAEDCRREASGGGLVYQLVRRLVPNQSAFARLWSRSSWLVEGGLSVYRAVLSEHSVSARRISRFYGCVLCLPAQSQYGRRLYKDEDVQESEETSRNRQVFHIC